MRKAKKWYRMFSYALAIYWRVDPEDIEIIKNNPGSDRLKQI
jgi:hypothetical protein